MLGRHLVGGNRHRETAIWQLSCLPSWPQYCQATPTECFPCWESWCPQRSRRRSARVPADLRPHDAKHASSDQSAFATKCVSTSCKGRYGRRVKRRRGGRRSCNRARGACGNEGCGVAASGPASCCDGATPNASATSVTDARRVRQVTPEQVGVGAPRNQMGVEDRMHLVLALGGGIRCPDLRQVAGCVQAGQRAGVDLFGLQRMRSL